MRTLFVLLAFIYGGSPVIQPGPSSLGKAPQRVESLALRGRVDSLDVEESDVSHARVRLKLTMELVNNGTVPIILLNRQPTFPGADLAKTPDDFHKGNLLSSTYAGQSAQDFSEWTDLRGALDRQTPPSDLTRVLRAGATWQINVELVLFVDSAPWRIPRQKSLREIRDASPVMLRVICAVWPFNVEPKASIKLPFGRRLQRRWRSFGNLWLDDVSSEPIMVDFKSLQKPSSQNLSDNKYSYAGGSKRALRKALEHVVDS